MGNCVSNPTDKPVQQQQPSSSSHTPATQKTVAKSTEAVADNSSASGSKTTEAAASKADTADKKSAESKATTKPRVIVVGCSFFGITATQALGAIADEDLAEVIVIDKSDTFDLGATYQYAFTGRTTVEDTKFSLDQAKFSAKVIRRFNTTVESVDSEHQSIQIRPLEGEVEVLSYDYLLLAPGAQMYPERIPGLAENMHNMCDPKSTPVFKETFETIEEGTIVIGIAGVPYKCPPAPFEYAFLIDEMLTKRGVREKCRIVISCPKAPFPFGNDKAKEVFLGACKEKNVEFLAPWVPTELTKGEDGKCLIKYKSLPPAGAPPPEGFEPEHMEINADFVLGMYPHGAPEFLKPMCNPKGFVPADILTMETSFAQVFCMGDANWIQLPSKPPKPHPKAGAFAATCAKNAATVVDRLVRGESIEVARDSVIKTRQAFCYAESGFDTGILIGPKLLPDEDGPPGFVVEAPSAESFDKKRIWLRDVLNTFFGSDVGDAWAERAKGTST